MINLILMGISTEKLEPLPLVISRSKATLPSLELETGGLPASGPKPGTVLTIPGEKLSAIFSISKFTDEGVCSAGFNTIQLPVARDGDHFHDNINNGKFLRLMCTMTPRGSSIFIDKVFASNAVAHPSSELMQAAKYLRF